MSKLVSQVKEKIQDLVECVEPLSFYGFRQGQTIESVLLRLVASHLKEGVVAVKPVLTDSVLTAAAVELQEIVKASTEAAATARVRLEEDAEKMVAEEEARVKVHVEALSVLQVGFEPVQLTDAAMRFLRDPSKDISADSIAAKAVLGQWLLQTAVSRLLQVCTPERLYTYRESVPAEMLHMYFGEQEHFSLKRLLRARVSDHSAHKLVIYTRTTAPVLALPAHGLEGVTHDRSPYEDALLEALICERFDISLPDGSVESISLDNFTLCPLLQLTTQEALIAALRSFFRPTDENAGAWKRALVFFINMSETPTSRVNFLRLKIDEMLDEEASKSVVLIMHFPSSNVYVQVCYAVEIGPYAHLLVPSADPQHFSLGSRATIRLSVTRGRPYSSTPSAKRRQRSAHWT